MIYGCIPLSYIPHSDLLFSSLYVAIRQYIIEVQHSDTATHNIVAALQNRVQYSLFHRIFH